MPNIQKIPINMKIAIYKPYLYLSCKPNFVWWSTKGVQSSSDMKAEIKDTGC